MCRTLLNLRENCLSYIMLGASSHLSDGGIGQEHSTNNAVIQNVCWIRQNTLTLQLSVL